MHNTHLQPAVQQVTNNSTNWIGHLPGHAENQMAGQTFTSHEEGPLEAIEIFPSVVTRPGRIILTLHYFDPVQKSWGPPVSSCSINVNCTESGKWLAFNFAGMNLHKGKVYGFRIESPDTFIGIAEAAGCYHTPPFEEGQEWLFTKRIGTGKFFSYYSLAFKVDMKAA